MSWRVQREDPHSGLCAQSRRSHAAGWHLRAFRGGLGDATAADFWEKVLAVCPLADRGIYTGERANSSCGVVSVTDVPYRELTEAMKTIAGEMYRRRHGADK